MGPFRWGLLPGRLAGGLLAAGVTFMAAEALAGDTKVPPEPPFETLTETWEARSTYIFRFDESVPPSRIPARAAALTRAVGGELRHTYTTVLNGFAARMPSTAMLRLLDMADDVVSVERDGLAHILAKPGRCEAEPEHPSCSGDEETSGGGTGGGAVTACGTAGSDELKRAWGVVRVDADAALAGGMCGLGVDVYVLDTGIDLDHPDLVPLTSAVDCTKGCVEGGDDKNGHGTHVAGTVAARANGSDVVGIAAGAKLHAVQVLGNSGMGSYSDIIAGIQHVMNQIDGKPVVINMSLGGSGGKKNGNACGSDGFLEGTTDSFHKAICQAAHAGVAFVVAAGNDGADAQGKIPAAYDDAVVTVSATDKNDVWPYWSNWGDDAVGWTSGVAQAPVAIAAPGKYVVSTKKGGGTTSMSGTSMASPHVAGAVALYLEGQTLDVSKTSHYDDVFAATRAAVVKFSEETANDVGNKFSAEQNKTHNEDFLNAYCLANGSCPIM